MKKIIYLFIILFGLITNAQIKFEKGYYLNNNNQKIEGFIKNFDWKNNPTEFEFKTQIEDTQSQLLNINEVAEFSIEGAVNYKRFTVSIEKSTDNLKQVTYNRNPVWTKETLFLKAITEGKASLYQYVHLNIYKYFYLTDVQPIEQLINIKYFTSENGTEELKTNSLYKNQLFSHVKCNDQKMEFFEQIKYSESDLLKQFNRFNTCNGALVKNTSETPKGIFSLKITAAANNAKLSVSDVNYRYNYGTSFGNKTIFAGGIEFEYFLPYNKYQWSIFTNPSYSKYSNSKKYTKNIDNNSALGQVVYDASVAYNNLEIPLGVRYHIFINQNSKLYVGLGYVFNSALNSEMNFKRDGVLFETLDVKPANNYLIGFGFNYKNKANLEFRYASNKNILTSYSNLNSDYSMMGLTISYKVL